MRKKLIAGSLVMAASSGAFAQGVYYESLPGNLPPGLAGNCMDVDAGDADNDGDLDLALAMEFARNRLLLNDGAGRFSDASVNLPDTGHDSEDVVFVDVDGDGDLDLFFVSEDDRQDELYLNDGRGIFADASTRLGASEVSNALAVLDLDADGDMDLLFGNIGLNAVLLNAGDGTFVDATNSRWPQRAESRTQDLELFDADGDGDLDLAVGNEGQNQLFINDAGVFSDASEAALPARDDETREIRAGDFDGDGDMDLAVANVTFLGQASAGDYLLLNDGAGRFTAGTAAFPEDGRSNFTIQSVDIDRDGDLDLLLPSTVFPTNSQNAFMFADGPDGNKHIYRIERFGLFDNDGDGDRDIVSRIDGQTVPFTNENGRFVLVEPLIEPLAIDRLDFDGDAQNDLAIANPELVLQDAAGAIFSQNNLEFFDVDDNGSVDAVVVAQSRMDEVGDMLLLINDGSGAFSRADIRSYLPEENGGNGFDIEVADFDGDGLQDLFFCNRASAMDYPVESGGLPRYLRGVIP